MSWQLLSKALEGFGRSAVGQCVPMQRQLEYFDGPEASVSLPGQVVSACGS